MKRHDNLAPLSREHHRFLVLAQVLKTGTPPYRGLPTSLPGKVGYLNDLFEHLILPHFHREENVLFPAIKGKSNQLDELMDVLVAEHETLCAMIRRLPHETDLEGALNEVGLQLALHVRKEERQFFELVQSTLSEAELQAIALD